MYFKYSGLDSGLWTRCVYKYNVIPIGIYIYIY